MKRISTNILLITVLAFSSCTGFLDMNPTTQPSEATFWKTENDFNLALAGIYGQLHDNAYFNDLYAMTDNLTDNSYDKNGCGSARSMMSGEIDPTMGGYISSMFKDAYSAIARVNVFIQQAEKTESLSSTMKERMLAEGRFFRAFHYSWLYLLYGDVPLVLHPLSMDNQYVEKSPAEEVYNQIIQDFDAAISGLPDVTYAQSGHITAGAAKAFKAKLMLQHAYTQGVPDKNQLSAVVSLLESIKGYSLSENFYDLFTTETQEGNPEIMFSVKNLSPASCSQIDMYYTNWLHTCPLRNLVDEFELKGQGEWKGSALAAQVNEAVLNGNDVAAAAAERAKLFIGRDDRLKYTIFHSLKPFPDFREITGETDYTGFGCYKYLQIPTTGDLLDGPVSAQDMIHMRYGYVLLMIAEAENEVNGANAKVYTAVNAIRVRAGQDPLPAGLSQSQMREKIRHEWRVETAMEGLRYFEMKRWHTLGEIVEIADPKYTDYQPKFEDRFYLWPIPQSEIDKAGGILVQNPNYL